MLLDSKYKLKNMMSKGHSQLNSNVNLAFNSNLSIKDPLKNIEIFKKHHKSSFSNLYNNINSKGIEGKKDLQFNA